MANTVTLMASDNLPDGKNKSITTKLLLENKSEITISMAVIMSPHSGLRYYDASKYFSYMDEARETWVITNTIDSIGAYYGWLLKLDKKHNMDNAQKRYNNKLYDNRYKSFGDLMKDTIKEYSKLRSKGYKHVILDFSEIYPTVGDITKSNAMRFVKNVVWDKLRTAIDADVRDIDTPIKGFIKKDYIETHNLKTKNEGYLSTYLNGIIQ